MIVVSDTSPVLSLARIRRLDLLRVLYQQVLIPSSVYQELRASSSQPPFHIDFDAVPWLIVATPLDRRRVEELREDLDLDFATRALYLMIEAVLASFDPRASTRRVNAAVHQLTLLNWYALYREGPEE